MSEENVLDTAYWKVEATSVINDIKDHVKVVLISDKIETTNECIHLNLITIEGNKFCIELSGYGFRIVGEDYDTVNLDGGQYFETPYSLLDSISPMYSCSFGNSLLNKLEQLKNKQSEESDAR